MSKYNTVSCKSLQFLRFLAFLIAAVILPSYPAAAQSNPIVFVTQLPNPADFGTTAATFGNHSGHQKLAGRGGDLWIRYGDGSLKNLTAAAGYGNSGFQGAQSIAVRDPSPHWNGQKVIFSMVVGAPSQRYDTTAYYWQLYEITGLQSSDTPVISKVANQPSNFNNIMPCYGTDGRILFVSDRTLTGERHLYPQRDEYEAAPINSGLWSLNPTSGDLFILDHSPSGDFSPIIDSFGRVLFTRWDHLQRDQENIGVNFGAFNYSDESSSATALSHAQEVFPEPRTAADPEYVPTLSGHTFNHFFPWQMNEDGTDMETLNHVGRHELHGYIPRTFNNDSNIVEYYQQYSRTNPNPILNFFHIHEDPLHPGTYLGIDAPEFGTHSAGQIVAIDAPPTKPAGDITVTYLTHRDTSGSDDTPSSNHIGLSRNAIVTSDSLLIASHTSNTRQDSNIGSSTAPVSRFDFRLTRFQKSGAYYTPTSLVTTGITKTVSFWDPDTLLTFDNVTMWELQPVELVARSIPAKRSAELSEIERGVFSNAGTSLDALKDYLTQNNLALLVSRDMTTRDSLDLQQPFNLAVPGGTASSISAPGKVYDIAHLQFFVGKLIRGYTQASTGRRVLAQPLDILSLYNPENTAGPTGSVAVAPDGSMAAFVPARRALTWQLTDGSGHPVIRERYWVTFQPGEIRVCASCHGVTGESQVGGSSPQNAPAALGSLLSFWNAGGGPGEGGSTVSRITLRAKKLPKSRFRVSGKLFDSNNSALEGSVSLLKVVRGTTTRISTAPSSVQSGFSVIVRSKRAMKVRASVGSVVSATITLGKKKTLTKRVNTSRGS